MTRFDVLLADSDDALDRLTAMRLAQRPDGQHWAVWTGGRDACPCCTGAWAFRRWLADLRQRRDRTSPVSADGAAYASGAATSGVPVPSIAPARLLVPLRLGQDALGLIDRLTGAALSTLELGDVLVWTDDGRRLEPPMAELATIVVHADMPHGPATWSEQRSPPDRFDGLVCRWPASTIFDRRMLLRAVDGIGGSGACIAMQGWFHTAREWYGLQWTGDARPLALVPTGWRQDNRLWLHGAAHTFLDETAVRLALQAAVDVGRSRRPNGI